MSTFTAVELTGKQTTDELVINWTAQRRIIRLWEQPLRQTSQFSRWRLNRPRPVRVLVAFIVVHARSLFGFRVLAKSSGPLKPPDLNATDETIVLVRS
ncbi:MAG TPA: hypothetical protein VN255_18550, partial [Mycobacterium sp.]|nr:hypothetical protein [Mycobacterium sp.]